MQKPWHITSGEEHGQGHTPLRTIPRPSLAPGTGTGKDGGGELPHFTDFLDMCFMHGVEGSFNWIVRMIMCRFIGQLLLSLLFVYIMKKKGSIVTMTSI